jgi:hypothetical protein
VVLNCSREAEWTPFHTPYLSENLVGPGVIFYGEKGAESLGHQHTSTPQYIYIYLVFREYGLKYAVVINSKSADISFTLSRSTNAN